MSPQSDSLLDTHDLLLLDLDGVCYLGDTPAPNAVRALETVKAQGGKRIFVTNNSSRTPQKVAQKLEAMGISAETHEVMNSAQAAIIKLQTYFPVGTKVLAVGGAGVYEALQEAGYEIVKSADENPQAVVQGLAETVNWKELSEAVLAIKRGAKHFATNLDATLPTERGELVGNGSLVAAVVNATKIDPIASGKPDPEMYEYVVQKQKAIKPLVVGDRLDTDIYGANLANYSALLVLTGVTKPQELLRVPKKYRPTYVGLDLSDLNLPVPHITVQQNEWRCADDIVTLQDTIIRLNGLVVPTKITLNQFRALLLASWHYQDQGGNIDSLDLPEFKVTRAL